VVLGTAVVEGRRSARRRRRRRQVVIADMMEDDTVYEVRSSLRESVSSFRLV